MKTDQLSIAIVSHTEHYMRNDQLVGWGPTIREINDLANHFERVVHFAMLHKGDAPNSALPYESNNIDFIPIPVVGGQGLMEKLRVLQQAFQINRIIRQNLKGIDFLQFRVPTGIGVVLLPLFSFFKPKPKVWVKYAGNWNQENPPLGYAFQRWWLKRDFLNCPVTINGAWLNQPPHCHTFENPCLNEEEELFGVNVRDAKDYEGPLTACFVGRLEEAKGVQRIIGAGKIWGQKRVKKIHFVGDGPDRSIFENKVSQYPEVEWVFHGGLPRNQVAEIMQESHLLLLPSTASEGFPKVIAEGMNFGAVPLVSDVSSIGQYINEINGFVWNRKIDFNKWLEKQDFNTIGNKVEMADQVSALFSFKAYREKLLKNVFL